LRQYFDTSGEGAFGVPTRYSAETSPKLYHPCEFSRTDRADYPNENANLVVLDGRGRVLYRTAVRPRGGMDRHRYLARAAGIAVWALAVLFAFVGVSVAADYCGCVTKFSEKWTEAESTVAPYYCFEQ
jgi:hypothetical protein